MEPGARPDAVPRWGASSTMVQPPDGEAAAGFATGSRPPAEWLNWMFNRHGAWIDFLRGPNVESWTRLAVAGTELDSATYRRFAIDTANPQVTDAFRFVLLGELTSTSQIRVSKTGDEWVTRSTHAPAGLTALGVTATNWLLGDDTGALYYGAIDDGTGTGPIGSDSTAWSTATGTVSGTVREFASNGSRVFCVSAGGGAYSDDDGATWATYSVSGTARSGDGWSTVYDGARWLFTTQSAQVYASSDGASFAYKATFSGTSTPWFLAVGAPGEVVAYRYHTASAAMYRSTDGGATWTTLTPSSTLKPIRITRLRYASGQWVATSDVAPYLWTSNDLVAWHPLRVPVSGSASKALGAVEWDGSAWWAVGRSMALRCARAADPGAATYTSADGSITYADAAYIRGRLVASTAPTSGQVLAWNAGSSQWEPAAGGGSSPTLAEGDLIIRGASADERLAIGGAGKVLTSNGTTATWEVGSPITTQGDLAVGDATGAPVRLAKGAEGKVLRAGATTVMWDDPPAPSGVAMLGAANVFTDLQTFGKSSGTWGAPIPVAAFRHNNGGGSSWQGVAVRFEVKNDSAPVISYGYVVARAYGVGGDANNNLVEMRPAFSAGDPPVGLRVRCNVASAIWGVELLLAASGGSPTFQPCRESGSGDVDLTIRGLGAGVVRLPAATGFVGTVTEITALTRPAGVMAFATNASGGPKPCWSTGSAWVLADGSALS